MAAILERPQWKDLALEERAKAGTRKYGAAEKARLTKAAAEALGIDFREHSYLWTLSTDQTDRYGDILEVPGWGVKEYFEGGSPVLWAHNRATDGSQNQNLPIGTMLKTWLETDKKPSRLRGVRHFHRETPLSRDVSELVALDILRTSSVGFLPRQIEDILDEAGNWTGGFRFLKQDLLEDSVVPVPANPGALVGVKGSLDGLQAFRRELERNVDEGIFVEFIDDMKAAHQELRTAEHFDMSAVERTIQNKIDETLDERVRKAVDAKIDEILSRDPSPDPAGSGETEAPFLLIAD